MLFPRGSDWTEIYEASPFPSLLALVEAVGPPQTASADIGEFGRAVESQRLWLDLRNRLADAARAYVLMIFYFRQGIPDKRWYLSPGRGGSSIEYFPDFRRKHFAIKTWFDFYGDVLYEKLFAAWDVLGHILNVEYDLNIRKATFVRAVQCVDRRSQELAVALIAIREAPAFAIAKKIRNDIAHNLLPSAVGMTVRRYETSEAIQFSFGLKEYVGSEEIVSTATQAIDLLRLTVQKIIDDRQTAPGHLLAAKPRPPGR